MNNMVDLYEINKSTELLNIWFEKLTDGLINAGLVVLYVLVCWLLLKLLMYIFNKTIKFTKIEKIDEIYNNIDILKNLKFKINARVVLQSLIKYLLILVFVIIGADLFGFTAVTHILNNIVDYLPNFFSALFMLIFGIYLASWVKNKLNDFLHAVNFAGHRIISSVVFSILLFFIVITALNQAKINTDVITNNVNLIIGISFSAIALAFGLGAKDVVKDLLYVYYMRKTIQVGDRIILENSIQGLIVAIDDLNVKISSEGNLHVISVRKFYDTNFQIVR